MDKRGIEVIDMMSEKWMEQFWKDYSWMLSVSNSAIDLSVNNVWEYVGNGQYEPRKEKPANDPIVHYDVLGNKVDLPDFTTGLRIWE